MGKLHDALTRERKTPDEIQNQLNYFWSAANRRRSFFLFRIALAGLALAGVLYGLGVLIFAATRSQ